MPNPTLAHKSRYSVAAQRRETPSFSPLFPSFSFGPSPHVMHLVAAVFELSQLALFALWPRLSPPGQNNTNLFCCHAPTPRAGDCGGSRSGRDSFQPRRCDGPELEQCTEVPVEPGSARLSSLFPLFSRKTFQPEELYQKVVAGQGEKPDAGPGDQSQRMYTQKC